MSVVSVVCYQIDGSATSRSMVQRSATVCGVIEKPHGGGLVPLGMASMRKNSHFITVRTCKVLTLWTLKFLSVNSASRD
jgi:hypothetical protein